MEGNINYTISRVLSGEATSEDVLTLSSWLNKSEKNQKEFRRLKSYWSAEVTYDKEILSSLSMSKLEENIKGNILHSHVKKRHSLQTVFSVAAAIILFVTLSFSYYFYHISQKQTEFHYYTYITGDEKSNFILKDGTKIILNKNSRLTVSNAYGKENRTVGLLGEAYFSVAKDKSKPFNVRMNKALITVLGTHFNVQANPESDDIIATLIEGSIKFIGAEQTITMTPNQQLTFSRSTNKVDVKSVDTEICTAWKNGVLKYKSISFVQLIRNLREIYEVDIQIENRKWLDPKISVSGTFDDKQNIDQVLEVIARSLSIKWYKENGIYYIR